MYGAWRIGIVEGVSETRAFQRNLFDAIHFLRELDAGNVINGRRNIVYMRELPAEAGLDVSGPADNRRVRVPPMCPAS
jgi:hypothetical protein